MIRRTKALFTRTLEQTGELVLLWLEVIWWTLRPPYRVGVLFRVMEFVGVGSLFIIVLTGTFTGAVMALQGIYAFRLINAESMVGGSVALALSRELSPVLTALMVTGRVGSAMATEIGTMRVTEQIDALETMSVNPIQYLVVPRFWAMVTMMPLLTIIFTMVGMVGCYVVAVPLMGVDPGQFLAKISFYTQVSDLVNGVIKSAVFGGTISIVSCYKGYRASGGARGVGTATTRAVVVSSVLIFVLDYVLTALMF